MVIKQVVIEQKKKGAFYMQKINNNVHPEVYEKTNFIHSEFVELHTNEFYTVQMQYPLLGMKNAEKRCLVRREVNEMLLSAAKLLPNGYRFKIFDAWRPFALQRELYITYRDNIVKDFGLENVTIEQQNSVIKKYVSEPVENHDFPPVHTTGGAVDLTIIRSDGSELNMGTAFDAFSEKADTAYFEDKSDYEIRDNRRLLYTVMTEVGFTNLPSEWWHYDYGDRFWAFYKNEPAIYKGVFTTEEVYE